MNERVRPPLLQRCLPERSHNVRGEPGRNFPQCLRQSTLFLIQTTGPGNARQASARVVALKLQSLRREVLSAAAFFISLKILSSVLCSRGPRLCITVRLWSLTTSEARAPLAESVPAARGTIPRNSQCAGEINCVQPARAAERKQSKLAPVVPALNRDASKRALHVRVCNVNYSLRASTA